MNKPTDSKLIFIKFGRGLSYFVYAFTITACIFLGLAFFMLLFGANMDTPFVQFIYNGANDFMQPFREIFPIKQFDNNSYFSPGILFAIIIYLLLAAGVNAFIAFITNKMYLHQAELEKAVEANARKNKR